MMAGRRGKKHSQPASMFGPSDGSESAVSSDGYSLDSLSDGEAVVDCMIKQGRDIVMQAISTYHPIGMVAAFSGGNDSIVTTHFSATEFFSRVIHCNTGIGLKQTTEHVRRVCERFGWDYVEEVAVPEGRTKSTTDEQLPIDGWQDGLTAYEEFVLNFGFPGPGQHPRMYQRLKERSIRRYVRRIKDGTPRGSKVLVISGIRNDESSIRAGYKRAVQQDPGNSAVIWANPFYWRSAEEFEIYRQEFGLPRNPVKDQIGISGECMCGAFRESDAERLAVRRVDPEFSEYLDRLEAKVHERGFPWDWGQRPPKWWMEMKRGQGFLIEMGDPEFTPMCVGCIRGRK